MLPLSLSTFAMAETNGCGLDQLLGEDEGERLTAWAGLYALLAGRTIEDVIPEINAHPAAFETFVTHIQQSFVGEQNDEPPSNHRRAKDPRSKIGTPDGRTMKSEDREGVPSTDYRLLFDLSRYARISLGDIYQMTFRGLGELSSYLKDNPPVPSSPFGGGDTI